MATKYPKLSGAPARITTESFFDIDCESLAKRLLGCTLAHSTDDGICSGRVVETEAYLGGEDKAAHSFGGKRTPKNDSMFLAPGTSYVYNIYGMYCCYNVSAKGAGAAVLVRALEPVGGIDVMKARREKSRKSKGKIKKEKDLCNGPSKLTQALGITQANVDKQQVTSSDTIWLEDRPEDEPEESISIVSGPRIGVYYAGPEWSMKPLRFYLRDNAYVSCATSPKPKKEASKSKKK